MTMRTRLLRFALVLGTVAFLSCALNDSARASTDACKPVKVCEPVQVVPQVKVCEPVKVVRKIKVYEPVQVVRKVKVCEPVKVVPLPQTCEAVKFVPPPKTCEPVKTCDSVKEHHSLLHGHYVYVETTAKHHLFKHDERTIYDTTPRQEPAPADVKPVEPTPAPVNAPAPPTPDKAA